MSNDPYLSKQSVGGLVERVRNTPPTRISISDAPFSSATIGLLIPTYWHILKEARLGDDFIIEIEKISGDLNLMTARCVKIVTSGVPTLFFEPKQDKEVAEFEKMAIQMELHII